MKNKLSTSVLIIAILSTVLLSSCSRKTGCYYFSQNEKPVNYRVADTDAQICMATESLN